MNKNKINSETPLLQNYSIRGEKESLNINCTEKSAKVCMAGLFYQLFAMMETQYGEVKTQLTNTSDQP